MVCFSFSGIYKIVHDVYKRLIFEIQANQDDSNSYYKTKNVTAQPAAGESARKVCGWSVSFIRTPFLRNFQLRRLWLEQLSKNLQILKKAANAADIGYNTIG
jgi:hypothetical protein